MLTVKDPKRIIWADMKLEDMAKGNVFDTYSTLKLFTYLSEELKKLNLYDYYKNLASPLIPVFVGIERRGMPIDKEELDKLTPVVKAKVDKFEEALYNFKQVKEEDNIRSQDDLIKILYTREDGFGLYPPFLTKKTNQPQVNKDTFEVLENLIEEELEKRAKSNR